MPLSLPDSYLGSRTISDAYTLEKYSDYDVETEVSSSIYNINGTDFTYSSVFDETLDKNLYTLPTGAYTYVKDADAFGRDSGNVLKNSEGEDLISYDYIYTTDTEAGTTTDSLVGWIATAGDDVNNFSYYYDNAGNITSIDLNGGLYVRYTYDERGQLLREDNVPKYRSYVYEYDNNGNVLSKKTYYLSTGMLTALPLSTETYTYGNSVWKDQLTGSSATGSITYDSMGNPTKWRGMSNITWNGRELTSFVKYNKTATYSYNADGIRTSYSFNGETVDYILDGTTILGEVRTDSDNNKEYIYYYYDENGEVTGLNYLGNDYYYIKNLQGDVMYITDDTGEIVVTYLYDAWGNILQALDDSWDYVSEVNPFTYRSYYYDFETGLYYLQSRYYDPQTGRFLNADDTNYLGASGTTLGYNLYAYCDNNPSNMIDVCGFVPYRISLISVSGLTIQTTFAITFTGSQLATYYVIAAAIIDIVVIIVGLAVGGGLVGLAVASIVSIIMGVAAYLLDKYRATQKYTVTISMILHLSRVRVLWKNYYSVWFSGPIVTIKKA